MPGWQLATLAILAASLLALHALSPMAGLSAALLIFLAGVPHGAVERSSDGMRIRPSVSYTLAYLAVAVLLLAACLANPPLGLLLFLGISAWHFSTEEPALRSVGPWIVLGSCVTYPSQTLDIFAAMTGADDLEALIPFARALGLAALAALMVEGAWRKRMGEAVFIVAILLVLPPIAAVALYFFGVHSLREWCNVSSQTGYGPIGLLRFYAPFALPMMAGGAAVAALAVSNVLPVPVAAAGAMAFALPHMLAVETWSARIAMSRSHATQGHTSRNNTLRNKPPRPSAARRPTAH